MWNINLLQKRFSVNRHFNTFITHISYVIRYSDSNELSQRLIMQCVPSTKKSTFNFDLRIALLFAIIH
jgi:hypothetical protein